ncbi:hypothetical protein GKZ89_09845 [Bacillus mangrovi]|uniref:Uncharacterized protein n=1 Tax=Metabacillus mangrovi TaxID=1491830 RepID=A0A7X2S550_9BACI|nr:hypothetical protein [Metabacillus mangrovi]MTH53705.1 hypothetical protein [Metabacillus mangrovi]
MKQRTYSLNEVLTVARALGLKDLYKSYAFLNVFWKGRRKIKEAAKTIDLKGEYAELGRYLTVLSDAAVWIELEKPESGAAVSTGSRRIMESVADSMYQYREIGSQETVESIIADFYDIQPDNSEKLLQSSFLISDELYNAIHTEDPDPELLAILKEDLEPDTEIDQFIEDMNANRNEVNMIQLYLGAGNDRFGLGFVPSKYGVWRVDVTADEEIQLIHESEKEFMAYISSIIKNGPPIKVSLKKEEEVKKEPRKARFEIKPSVFLFRSSLLLLGVMALLLMNVQEWVISRPQTPYKIWAIFQGLIAVLTLVIWKYPKERKTG